jgi:hypothetical protein
MFVGVVLCERAGQIEDDNMTLHMAGGGEGGVTRKKENCLEY